MHDITELDRRGIPGGFLATVEFEVAAKSQARALGFEPAVVYVPHPVQNRTPQELDEMAKGYCDEILAMITAGE